MKKSIYILTTTAFMFSLFSCNKENDPEPVKAKIEVPAEQVQAKTDSTETNPTVQKPETTTSTEEVTTTKPSTTDETPQENSGLKGTDSTPIKPFKQAQKDFLTFTQSKEYQEYLESQKPIPDGFFMTGNTYKFKQQTPNDDFLSDVTFLVMSKDYINIKIKLLNFDGTSNDYGNDHLSFKYDESTNTISFHAMGRDYSVNVKELKTLKK
ncbi:hypothetical protein KMW28_19440 [Flammeovirga yaeyamensis]|uniref:Lipoprotein n=1 Tax=Flammeovirga yaeyamensis TaxID=367791 RepID=A0AAX1N3A3_9BACT|nr:hypothetical protein [Flammeovirga yaeyamensis]MBB3700798.1 hypothetical protein [Flammeovirga yaeyamensis]NMF37847.1 hypothetical protein [Flammeovirga yaeyamensis]QWG01791.1 hypothetical protein KMW28_19440 [Flammeovirga yaeyamensis]